jgi:peptide/nickel transport system substrate-binding protein
VRTLAAALAAALALAAPPARAGVRPAYGGTVRVLLPAAPRVLDPARALEPADLFAVRALHAPLLEVDAAGRLAPGLLAEVPAPEAGGRAFRLRLAPGLRFSDGSAVTAASVAFSLSRLLARDPPSPHAWVALPILGADALLDGRAATLAGVQVLSDRELLVTLAFPFPDFPWALAALPAAVVSPRGAGAGPFVLETQDAAGSRLAPNPNHARGRPFAGALILAAADARSSARALSAGGAELVLRPEPGGAGAIDGPALTVVAAAVNGRRLGAAAAPLAGALRAVDRAELARLFVRAPATPMDGLVPPALLAAPAPPLPAGAAAGAPPPRVGLLVPAGAPDLRAAADRIQVRLFDRGVRAAVEEEPAPRFAARVAAGDFDVAIAAVPVLALRPALAAGEVTLALRGPAAARRAMAALAGLPPEDAAARATALARELDVVPLFATGQRATAAPALQGARFRADGAIDAGDLWLLGGAP